MFTYLASSRRHLRAPASVAAHAILLILFVVLLIAYTFSRSALLGDAQHASDDARHPQGWETSSASG